MNNLKIRKKTSSPFNFLSAETDKPKQLEGCGAAWVDGKFWLGNDLHYFYICHSCDRKRVNRIKDNKWYD